MAIKNAERYLGSALDSLSAQSYDDFEIIVVDGDSTDSGKSIAQSYPRVRVLPQNGVGFAHAWNVGIEASRAPLIAFLDSDDIWPPHRLACQVDLFLCEPAIDCVVGRTKFFLDRGCSIPPGFKASLLEGSHVAYMPGTTMVRRGIFDRLGKFEERWNIASDIAWFAKLRDSGLPTKIAEEIYLYKRVHAANLSYVTAASVYRQELLTLLRESLQRRHQGEA